MSTESDPAQWRISVDTGGTFTDCIAVSPDGAIHRAKTLSSAILTATVLQSNGARSARVSASWLADGFAPIGALLHAGERRARIVACDCTTGVLTADADVFDRDDSPTIRIDPALPAPILVAHMITGTALGAALPPIHMRLATTRATNALLERNIASVAMFVTEGFADLLTIADQRRPDLFALEIKRPRSLTDLVYEAPGRLNRDGAEIRPLDEEILAQRARQALQAGAEIGAVALVNSWKNAAHEQRFAEILREAGFDEVVLSSDVSPVIRYLPRAQTTLVDACLRPVLGEYLDAVRAHLGDGRLHVMTSAGGLDDAVGFSPADGLLSGPAGGVVGALEAGRRSGVDRIVSFDMGGTSTDVARLDGAVEYTFEHTVGDARILRPAAAIETVAAGGGSICRFEHGRALVGPESAGADPGPACYGAGGPLTVTDCNVLLGRIDTDQFETTIDTDASARAMERVLVGAGISPPNPSAVAQGFVDLADTHMAEAIRRVSVRMGYDPSEYALVAFGGAGPQHACAVAERLGCKRVIIPSDASILSAVGLQGARLERFAEKQILESLSDVAPRLGTIVGDAATEAAALVRAATGDSRTVLQERHILRMRYRGQEQAIEVEIDDLHSAREAFEARYAKTFGSLHQDRSIEVESVRVAVSAAPETPPPPPPGQADRGGGAPPVRTRRVCVQGEWREIPAIGRDRFVPGETLEGPALVTERRTSTFVAPGWAAAIDDVGAIVLNAAATDRQSGDSIMRRELLTARLTGIAEQMGDMLARTAVSTNVKDRLDFSCAVMDPDGCLVASAPHMPVHLGALGECTRAVLKEIDLAPGDVAITNHPAFGGSHLPDITLVHAIAGSKGRLLGYVASRAHHAEIGGLSPGSMPANARTLADEGVAIAPMKLVEGDTTHWDSLRGLLGGGAHPSRAIEENLADIRAALAAGRWSGGALQRLCDSEGADLVVESMRWIQEHTEAIVRERVAKMDTGECNATEPLDDGSVIRVRIEPHAGGLRVDFTGTSGTHPQNLNAPFGVVRSAVLYVMRLLIDRDVPLNDGLLRAIDIVAPEGCMLNPVFDADPAKCPAVAGGNVETSQRIVDALLRALGLMAASQGTMNNTIIGNERFSYYETVCGGSGAGPGFHGCSGVHTHMTNTAVTDVELVEHRYPMRIERFALRPGSGGAGEWAGGDGIVREYVFDEPVEISVVGQRRVSGAPGSDGGGAGQPGVVQVASAAGASNTLQSIDSAHADTGDRLILETPGGGGWGNGA